MVQSVKLAVFRGPKILYKNLPFEVNAVAWLPRLSILEGNLKAIIYSLKKQQNESIYLKNLRILKGKVIFIVIMLFYYKEALFCSKNAS